MKLEGNILSADEGCTLIRKESGEDFGAVIYLGYSYYIGGKLQEPPHMDIPDDFKEVKIKEQ